MKTLYDTGWITTDWKSPAEIYYGLIDTRTNPVWETQKHTRYYTYLNVQDKNQRINMGTRDRQVSIVWDYTSTTYGDETLIGLRFTNCQGSELDKQRFVIRASSDTALILFRLTYEDGII